MDGVILTSERVIQHPKGDILHAMKSGDAGFCGFGEAYFSKVVQGEIKGWKMHSKMTLNLLVPIGGIEIVVCDGSDFFSVVLSSENYQRLTIKPKLWVAFKGLTKNNMLLNLASHPHDPAECVTMVIDTFNFHWTDLEQ